MPQLKDITGYPKISVNGKKAHFHGTKDALYARWDEPEFDENVHLKFTFGYNPGANKVTASYVQCITWGKEGLETTNALNEKKALEAAKGEFKSAIEVKIKTDFVK